jgi:X-X-X-Leu-X-X-Gly heptad repeat protein
MDWKMIPSLAALRAFEATSRLQSLSQAAAELNVTHAAVSQHLRTLEAEFGCALMDRIGRGVQLTDQGRLLANALADGFGTIADGVAQLRDAQTSRPLVVCVTPSLLIVPAMRLRNAEKLSKATTSIASSNWIVMRWFVPTSAKDLTTPVNGCPM